MSRYASSNYEEKILKLNSAYSLDKLAAEPAFNVVKLNNSIHSFNNNYRTKEQWLRIFPNAVFFKGFDMNLGIVLIMVYEDPDSPKISTVIFSKLGEQCFNALTLSKKSRFYVACENLNPEHKKTNVRRALAITLLKTYSIVHIDFKNVLAMDNIDWDETVAGEVASSMMLLRELSPLDIGKQLLSMGFLQQNFIDSTVLDVIYEDKPDVIDDNNKLVFLIGEQLEQLFDPLTEYSPEASVISYVPPDVNKNNDDATIKSICDELIEFQKAYTQELVEFLKQVVIPFRVKSLNGEFSNINAAKMNQILPPTIDEVTRVNCLFLDSLLAASPFGSFEIIKVCGQILPHFYKPYTRHESALKNFSAITTKFFKDTANDLPQNYNPEHIEKILSCSKNLARLKTIIEKLVNVKQWMGNDKIEIEKYYQSSLSTTNSFGKENLSNRRVSYNRRVFTPSGKLLTELCEGWPSQLSYGWLNRKVVSIFDATDAITNAQSVIILFNDFIIFAEVKETDEDKDELYKPKISDILMNSLVNENPIGNIPVLKVTKWSSIVSIESFIFNDDNHIRFILGDNKEKVETVIYEVDDASKLLRLINKSVILSKSTPFHLFKNTKFGFTIYSTAHERSSYIKEQMHSKIGLFLNLDVDEEVLDKNRLFAALSAKLMDQDTIFIKSVTLFGETLQHTINSSELSTFLSEEISTLLSKRYSHNKLYSSIMSSNDQLLRIIGTPTRKEYKKVTKPKPTLNSGSLTSTRKLPDSRQISTSSRSSIIYNKPLPKVNENTNRINQKDSQSAKKKSKLKNRLSRLFSKSKKKSTENLKSDKKPVTPSLKQTDVAKTIPTLQRSPDDQIKFNDKMYDIDRYSEISDTTDIKTFESTMTPIYDDDSLGNENFEVFNEDEEDNIIKSPKKVDNKDSSAWRKLNGVSAQQNAGTDGIVTTDKNHLNNELGETDKAEIFEMADQKDMPYILDYRRTSIQSTICHKEQFSAKGFNTAGSDNGAEGGNEEGNTKDSIEDKDESVSLRDFAFSSIDEFEAQHVLNVKIDMDDDNDDDSDDDDDDGESDVFYTPKSFGDQFPKLEPVHTPLTLDKDKKEEFLSTEKEYKKEPSLIESDSFKNIESVLEKDESFKYLATVLENSAIISQNLKRSETLQTIPRSFSSMKYLAPFIDINEDVDDDPSTF